VKRMWLAPEVRGRGAGRRLLVALEEEARRLGYRVLRLDTRSELVEAVALYRSSGYRDIAPYNANPDADTWFEKAL
jgi:ribosomal protein S18 acetylase RimI-like enzyme